MRFALMLIAPTPLLADSTWAVVTLVGAVLTVVGVVVGGLIRNSKSSPEVRDAQIKGWDLLTGNLTKEVERVSAQVERLQSADRDKSVRILVLESQIASLTSINGWLRRYLQKLLAFIHALPDGIEPPAPDDPEPMPPVQNV